MPVVLLVRHGQAGPITSSASDYDVLSERGRHQARLVGDELRRRALRDPVVVHGSLERQRATAALALPGIPAREDPRWDEYDHMDLLERYVREGGPAPATSREVQDLLDAALLAWVQHGDAGGWPVFADGAADALRELVADLGRGRDAVVFTSGGIVAAVCAVLIGGGAQTVVALNRVTVNAAVTKLVAGSSGTSLVAFNEHAHLTGGDVTYR